MKKKLLISILIIPFIIFSQKNTRIIPPNGGFFVIKKKEYTKMLKYTEDKLFIPYLIAVKTGYATQAFDIDSILNLNIPEHQLTLDPVVALDLKKVAKSIVFSGFIDKTNLIDKGDVASQYYGFTRINIKASEYYDIVTNKLKENNFKVINNIKENYIKKDEVDYCLTGEIINYDKQTRGIPGFLIGLVIEWTLFDIESDIVKYKFITGGYSNTKTTELEYEALKSALKDAVNGVIINKNVTKYIYGEMGSEKNITKPEIIIPNIEKKSKDENYINTAIQSSLTIKTNSDQGSGFLISSNGYVLTNYKVIKDSTNIQGIFKNGLTLPLRIISFDKKTDVAICKISGTNYKPLPIDTTSIIEKIGSEVYSIGTPEDLRLAQSISKGVISGLREINNISYIQTDVSINKGYSGGMLINKKGEIIGIVSSKIEGEGIEGLGFVTPILKALKSLNIKIKVGN